MATKPKRGRPVSTGSWSTPTIQYRVSAIQHTELALEAKRFRLTVNEVAKRRAFPPPTKNATPDTPRGYSWDLALCCPLTKEVRYVGQSNDPHGRLVDHLSSRATWNVKQWAWQLKAKKLDAIQITIAFVNQSEADEQEKFWINYFRERVKLLLNSKHHRQYISSWEIKRSFNLSSEYEGHYTGYLEDE